MPDGAGDDHDGSSREPRPSTSQPARATVRRYWPNQADMLGYLVRTPVGYAIRYESGSKPNGGDRFNGNGDQPLFQFGADAIKLGQEIFLTEPDGHQARFRIASLQ